MHVVSEEETVPSDAGESLKQQSTGPEQKKKVARHKELSVELCLGTGKQT